jgi:non-heme chloroperoxidase
MRHWKPQVSNRLTIYSELSMRCASWVNALSLAALVGCTSPQSDSATKGADGPRDSSARDSALVAAPIAQTRHITVAPDVALEVLDWGGVGEPLVFLAGLGNTAHVFEDFAPAFANTHRVVAITRRGFGASSQPEGGYDIETRVADLRAIMDSLGFSRVNFVGHSIAGGELTAFAARHPDRVRRLVYLDAAYDHRIQTKATRPPLPPMSSADSSSPEAVLAYSSLLGQPLPLGEIRATEVFDSTGHLVRDVTPGSAYGKILKGLETPRYAQVTAPALAFYAGWTSPERALSPTWWRRMSAADQAQTRAALLEWSARSRNERAKFLKAVRFGKAIELPEANHFVWLTDRVRVLAAMRAFLADSVP